MERIIDMVLTCCYIDLILQAHAGNEEKCRELIQHGADLFAERERDTNYTQFTTVDGSAESNRLCVDYRLAAIVEYFFADSEVKQALPEMHRWRPGG